MSGASGELGLAKCLDRSRGSENPEKVNFNATKDESFAS